MKNAKKNNPYDVYCFGLILIEMISSDIPVPHAFKYLCKLLNHGAKDKIFEYIVHEDLRNLLINVLDDNPENRLDVKNL